MAGGADRQSGQEETDRCEQKRVSVETRAAEPRGSGQLLSYMQGVTCNDGDMQADFMHTLLP